MFKYLLKIGKTTTEFNRNFGFQIIMRKSRLYICYRIRSIDFINLKFSNHKRSTSKKTLVLFCISESEEFPPSLQTAAKDPSRKAYRKHHRPKVRQSVSLDSPRPPPKKKPLPKVPTAPVGNCEPWCYDADIESPLSEKAPPLNGQCIRFKMPCDVLVRSRSSVCVPCKGSVEQDEEPDLDDMSTRSGRKQIYETAFDSRVSKSEDELDEVNFFH
jgi:hypothetical protein